MAMYRKVPVVIEAMQNDGTFARADTICHWAARNGWGERVSGEKRDDGYTIVITTLEGVTETPPTSWVIKGVKGEFYPCADDIFEATYEPS
jgi:hypothetical protein